MKKHILSNIDGDAFYDVSVCGDEGSIKLSDVTVPLHEEIKIVCILGNSRHAEEIKNVKAHFVKNGYVVLTEPYDVNTTDDDTDCVKTVIENSINIANLIYVVNVDGTDSFIEDYIKLAKTLNKKIEYHYNLQEIDLSTYFTINKNRLIDEVNEIYSNLIRITKAIESIIGKMVDVTDGQCTNWMDYPYTGKKPVICSAWTSIGGHVTTILWNGYSFNIKTQNEYINGVTQNFVKLEIVCPDCNLYGIPKSATLNVKIDDHTYSLSKDETNDPEIKLTVCKIFDAVIEELKLNMQKNDETTN